MEEEEEEEEEGDVATPVWPPTPAGVQRSAQATHSHTDSDMTTWPFFWSDCRPPRTPTPTGRVGGGVGGGGGGGDASSRRLFLTRRIGHTPSVYFRRQAV